MKTVTFYHSAICPRCQVSGLLLSRVLRDFPDVRIEKVELLAHRREASEAGVRMIPALVSGDRRLTGVLLTAGRMRAFLASL